MQKEINDGELIERFLNNDINAFDILYTKYKNAIYGYLFRFFNGQKHLADDIFQQTWIKAIANLSRYRHNEKFLTWILRISHNLAIDHFRKSKAETIVDFSDPAVSNELSDENKFWNLLDHDKLAENIENCISKLPPDQKEVFLLRQEDIPFKEIAEIQNCSVNTALGRMLYALRNLKSCLSKWRQQ